jgi:hypothetical protein
MKEPLSCHACHKCVEYLYTRPCSLGVHLLESLIEYLYHPVIKTRHLTSMAGWVHNPYVRRQSDMQSRAVTWYGYPALAAG